MHLEGGKKIQSFLLSIVHGKDDVPQEERRVFFLINIFSLLAFLTLTIFGLVNLLAYDQVLLGGLEVFGALLIAVNFGALRLYYHTTFSKHFLLYVVLAELIIMLLTGGISYTGIFWFFTFPAPVFYLEGRRGGLVWMVLFIFVTLLVALLSREGYFLVPYSIVTIRQMLIALCVVGALTYSFEVAREQAEHEERAIKNDLEKNRVRFLALERMAHIGIWEWDVAADHLVGSEEIFKLHKLPYQQEPMSSEEFFSQIAPEDRTYLHTVFSQALTNGIPFSFEYRIRGPHPEDDRVVKGQGEVEFDEHGRPTSLFGTLQDITASKTFEHRTLSRATELERMNTLMIGRELKMADLKKRLATYAKTKKPIA